ALIGPRLPNFLIRLRLPSRKVTPTLTEQAHQCPSPVPRSCHSSKTRLQPPDGLTAWGRSTLRVHPLRGWYLHVQREAVRRFGLGSDIQATRHTDSATAFLSLPPTDAQGLWIAIAPGRKQPSAGCVSFGGPGQRRAEQFPRVAHAPSWLGLLPCGSRQAPAGCIRSRNSSSIPSACHERAAPQASVRIRPAAHSRWR